MKVLITGSSSVGKSTVIKELIRQGFAAYSTDEIAGATRLEYRDTGLPAEWPEGYVDWDKYAWNWQRPVIERLLASNETIFVGAIAFNQSDYYHLFDEVIVLTLDIDTLLHRLQNRTDRVANVKNIESMIQNHLQREDRYIEEGAIPIDNSGPVQETVASILHGLQLDKPKVAVKS